MILFSASKLYGIYYYDMESDLLYWKPSKGEPMMSGAVPGFFSALFLGALLLIVGFRCQWNWWMWILADLLSCGIVFTVARGKRCKFEEEARNGKIIVLKKMRKKDMDKLVETDHRLPMVYFCMIGMEETIPFCVFYMILALYSYPEGLFTARYFWPAAVALFEIYSYLLPSLPERRRKACIQRIKNQIKQYEAEHNIGRRECAEEFLKLFPQAQPVYEEHMTEHGRLILELFLVEALTKLQFEAELSGKQSPVRQTSFYSFIEEMLRHGNDEVQNVVYGVGSEYLKENTAVWDQFCESISDELLTELDAAVMNPGHRGGECPVNSKGVFL